MPVQSCEAIHSFASVTFVPSHDLTASENVHSTVVPSSVTYEIGMTASGVKFGAT